MDTQVLPALEKVAKTASSSYVTRVPCIGALGGARFFFLKGYSTVKFGILCAFITNVIFKGAPGRSRASAGGKAHAPTPMHPSSYPTGFFYQRNPNKHQEVKHTYQSMNSAKAIKKDSR